MSQEEEEEYEVEAVIGKRTKNGETEFHLKWKGYPLEESTWERAENCKCQKLINDFLASEITQKNGPKKRKQPIRSNTQEANPPARCDDSDDEPLAATKKQKTKHFVLKTVESPPPLRPNCSGRTLRSIVLEEISGNNEATMMTMCDATSIATKDTNKSKPTSAATKRSKPTNDMPSTSSCKEPKSTSKPSTTSNAKKQNTKTNDKPQNDKIKKARVVKDNTFHHYTLVRGLNNMIRPEKSEQLMFAINELVPLVSKSMVLGSWHTHVRLMEIELEANRIEQETGIRVENQLGIRAEFTPPSVINARGQVRKIGYVVEKDFNPTKQTRGINLIHTEPINANFKRHLDVYDVDIPHLPYGANCHNYATNQYTTNFHNNIRYRAYNRVRAFFNVHSNDRKSKRETLKYLFYVEPKKRKAIPDPLPIPNDELLKLYRKVLRPLLPNDAPDRVPLGWLGASLRDKIDWYRHVHEFIQLQLWIYSDNLRRDGTDEIQLRSFTAIPQNKVKRHHITITTRILGGIVNSFECRAEKISSKDYESSDVAIRTRIWNKYFRLEWLNSEWRYFDLTMTTDGVSAHFVMRNKQKQKSKREVVDVNGDVLTPEIVGFIDDRIVREISDEMRQKYNNNEYKTIIGYDPGYKLPVAIVRKDIATGDETNFTMNWYEFRKLCGDVERKQKRYRVAGKHEKKMRQLRENRTIYPEQPSNKSHDIWTYIDYQCRVFHRSCAVYMRRSYARLEFDRYICTQRALHKIARIIMPRVDFKNPTRDCILAAGDFKFSANSPIRGSVRCPMRSLFNLLAQQYCDVVEIDEHLTSKLCSICGSRMIKKGTRKDRYFICKNKMPATSILPQAPAWTTKRHIDRIRDEFNELPLAGLFIHQDNGGRRIKRTIDLPTERRFHSNELDDHHYQLQQHEIINGNIVAKHKTIVWNRDINAPRNMIYKLLCMLNGVDISPVFKRRPRLAEQQQQQQQQANDNIDDTDSGSSSSDEDMR